MFVAASTECYSHMSLVDALDKLNDLEYRSTEISIRESGDQIKPSQVLASVEDAITLCRDTHRLDLAGFAVDISATGDEHYAQFEACCRLAKATKVISMSIPSAELGTPFNEEVEHLRRLVDMAQKEGVLVSIRTQVGRLSEDPDTCVVICDNVKGLGVTLDPSTFVCGPHAGRDYEKLMKYTYNVHLRDSSKDEHQVRVGQGVIEYGKLVNQLRRVKYGRSYCVNMQPMDGLDHDSEMRKIRLLLESLL